MKRYAKEEAEDRTESKAETIKYVYGNGLISQTDTNGCRYYHYNHLGSTMQLTDKDGNVTDRYTYGTYGELLSGDTEHTRFLYNGRYGVTTDENGLYYMRARYYNTDIRRFINQDIITGSIGNSQSLNRYAYVQGNPVSYTDPFGLSPLNAMADTVGHAVLDLIGSIPVFGAPANILNCYWYYKEKNYEMAVMSGIAILPGVGQFIGAGLKAFKYTRAAQYIITTTKFAGSMANCMIAVGTCIDTGKRIYHDIRNGKFGLNVNTVANIATIGISAFAAAVSGKEMAGAGAELTNMVAEDLPEFGAKVDALLSRLKINNKGFTYLYQPKNNGNGIEGGSGYVNIDTGTANAFISQDSPIRHQLKNYVSGKQMVMTETAMVEFKNIVNGVAGDMEKARAERFLKRVKIIPDAPSSRALNLNVTKKVGANDIIIFGTGDNLNIVTMTSDAKFVRGASAQGVDFDVFIHTPTPYIFSELAVQV